MAITKFASATTPKSATEAYFFNNWSSLTVTKKEEYGEYVARIWPQSTEWLIGFAVNDSLTGEARARVMRILARKVRDIRQGGQPAENLREDLSHIVIEYGQTPRQAVTNETPDDVRAISENRVTTLESLPQAIDETIDETLSGDNRFLGFLSSASGSVGLSFGKLLLPVAVLLILLNLPAILALFGKRK